jgi:peptidoglycan/xylan/chitin deacetylase (PgdA/CDA1 family)
MRNLIVGSAWLSPIALIILWQRAPMLGLAIMALSHAAWLYATLRANVQWLGPVITRFETNAREVWLTIDDGPTSDTPAILELLQTSRVVATFFVKGALAAKNGDLVRAIIERGNHVANHSDDHPSGSFWRLLPAEIARQIDRCNATLQSLTSTRPIWFRAPVGMKNPAVHPALEERGMRLIGWSVRGLDTVRSDPADVATRIVPRTQPGSIIVLHQGRENSLACLQRVISGLQAEGYAFVIPADERLKTKR